MKSQDILILLKLASMEQEDENLALDRVADRPGERYSVRNLAAELGISKTEVSASINRSISSGLAVHDRHDGHPKPNRKALLDFIVCGLKYVFPVKPGAIVRGVATAYAAPVLKDELRSTGEYILVWPYAEGREKGQSVTPLFKSAPLAARNDPHLYEYLALADAIRLGSPRESNLAAKRLKERLLER